MKKSRITKLALSGAAVAALAATFSTSTYAWYVSNKTANVTAVAGSTASSGASSSISLSTTGQLSDYHKTISLADKTSGLSPVVRTGSTINASGAVTATYKILDENTDADTNTDGIQVGLNSTAVTSEGSYFYEYVFYIKSESACTVKPVITVKNITQDIPTQVNYSGGYKPVAAVAQGESIPTFASSGPYYSYNSETKKYTVVQTEPQNWATTYTSYFKAESNKVNGVTPGADFTVDALKAVHMSLGVIDGKPYTGSQETFEVAETPTAREFAAAVDNATGFINVTGLTIPGSIQTATDGARVYYEDITGTQLTADATTMYTSTNGLQTFGNIALVANVPYKLVYHLWLDGADDQCFNACAGQMFSVAFDYTVQSN